MAKALEKLKKAKATGNGKATKGEEPREEKRPKMRNKGASGPEARNILHPRGRKPMFPGEDMVTIAFRLPVSVVERIDKRTANRAELIRTAIDAHLANLRAEKKAKKAAKA